MTTSMRRLPLMSGQLANLDDARGTVVRVSRGRLWLTQDGDRADHVLEAGDSWMIERDGRTIVEAQVDSLVDLSGSGAARVILPLAVPIESSRAAGWIARVADDWISSRRVPYF